MYALTGRKKYRPRKHFERVYIRVLFNVLSEGFFRALDVHRNRSKIVLTTECIYVNNLRRRGESADEHSSVKIPSSLNRYSFGGDSRARRMTLVTSFVRPFDSFSHTATRHPHIKPS